MNKSKLLIASLIALSMPGLVSADNKPTPQNGFGFTGVGIGSSQYLGVYLSTPPAPTIPTKPGIDGGSTPPTPPVCNVDIQVLGDDGQPNLNVKPITNQIIQPGTTVFLRPTDPETAVTDPTTTGGVTDPATTPTDPATTPTDPVISPATGPQYFNVSVKINTPSMTPGKDKKNMVCAGLTGTLGVYDKTSQNLQVLVPMLPAPLK
ncbi:MAG: hypothetical protein EPN17_14370 [Methylobacter sp.]|nr:MAG: hypothetical protein EPN17_14370 [Methylobacter sp.]